MAGSTAGSVAVDLVLNDRAFNSSVRNNIRSTESAYKASFNKIAGFIATAFAVDKVANFGKEAVKAASDAQAAWTGLNSIVEGTGNNFDVAHSFLTKFTQDGLVGIEDAATAYKSLLARGYDTTQIENVMTALKDSAAFGRQSSYTLSEAVVSAAEGLKNENSILVDNAGVTKNVAKMWEEYAASIGTTRDKLTQQQKIQAEVNGILEETKFQTGDAATYTNTFAGRVQILKGAFSSMQIAIGKVVAPIVGLFIPALTSAINAVTAFFTKLQGVLKVFGLDFPDVVSKTTTSVGGATDAIGGMGGSASDAAKKIAGTGTAAKKAAKEAKRAFASVDEINVINTKDTSASSGSGGSDGGASGGVGGSSAVNTGNDAVSEAVKSTAEKIMKYIAPLQAINFDNLIKAFGLLKEAALGLGGTIWQGLEWAYFNLLVPLAQWTIEDFLPAFFYALSGALNAVNGILQEVYPIFILLWDNFLKPIASWTGGVIVSALYAIGDALNWVGDHANLVIGAMVGLGSAWVTFKALGILGSIMQFIKYSAALAGTTGIINSLGAAVSMLWTYFKGGSIVTTVIGWFTKLSGIFTGVATAIGISTGALLGIIAVVAAVAAGAYLLVTNWDSVKNFFSETLPKVMSNLIDWFKELPGKIGYWMGYAAGTVVKYLVELFTVTIPKKWKEFQNWAKEIPSKLETFFTKTIPEKWKELEDFFKNIDLKEIGKNIINGLIDGITFKWKVLWTTISEFIEGFIKGFKDALGIHSPSTLFAEIGQNIIQGLINGVQSLLQKVKEIFTNIVSTIKSVWGVISGWVKDKIITPISNLWTGLKTTLTNTITGIKTNMINIFNSAKTTVLSTFESIKKGITDKITAAKNTVGNMIEKIKGFFKFQWSLPTIKTPHISWSTTPASGWIAKTLEALGLPSSIPKMNVEWYAQGGWLKKNNPQLAVVGDNKRENEIIAPESKIREQVKQAINELGGNIVGTTQKIALDITVRTDDGRKIIKKINDVTIEDGKVSLII